MRTGDDDLDALRRWAIDARNLRDGVVGTGGGPPAAPRRSPVR